MKGLVLCLLFMFYSAILFAEGPERSPFTGDGMEGSGLCGGGLRIKTKTLTWTTAHSECKNLPYKTIEYKKGPNSLHAVYELESHNRRCLFRILVLEYLAPPDGKPAGFEWNITGYGSGVIRKKMWVIS